MPDSMSSNNQKKPKAAFYDPYLDTLGGGERYVLTAAQVLSENGYDVDLFWSGDPSFLTKAQNRFSLDLSKINIVPDIFNQRLTSFDMLETFSESIFLRPLASSSLGKKISNFINRAKILSQYDFSFYLSDGSLPFLFAKHNMVHFQVPFIFKFSFLQKLLNQIKFLFINQIVCNSSFTSKVFKKTFNHANTVLYPPVGIEKFSSSPNKENIILNVGRFDNLMNTKKQDVLIDAFKEMSENNPSLNWRLVLAGGSKDEPKDNKYLAHLMQISLNLPIDIIVNPSFPDLVSIYSKSKIYWHAAGYGVDQTLHPENTEHFGITVVEAMSSGLVPMVVNRGGLPEIIDDQKTGFLWETIGDLIEKTTKLINSNSLFDQITSKSIPASQVFSQKVFSDHLLKLVKHK